MYGRNMTGLFLGGMVAGMAVLAAGCMMLKSDADMHCLRAGAADTTVRMANEAGRKISYMGKRIARKMR